MTIWSCGCSSDNGYLFTAIISLVDRSLLPPLLPKCKKFPSVRVVRSSVLSSCHFGEIKNYHSEGKKPSHAFFRGPVSGSVSSSVELSLKCIFSPAVIGESSKIEAKSQKWKVGGRHSKKPSNHFSLFFRRVGRRFSCRSYHLSPYIAFSFRFLPSCRE